jgi:bilirubin oxidase
VKIDCHEVEVKSLDKKIYPDLIPMPMVGYDGLQSGPTFVVRRGHGTLESIPSSCNFTRSKEAVIRFVNNCPMNMTVHVHGQYNHAPFEGWAADYKYPSKHKDYHYPNAQNVRTIWYYVRYDSYSIR